MPIGSPGLLIIRAYLETESPAPLRAEIRLTSDVSAGIERALTLVDVDRVAEVVRSWLLEDILKTPVGSSPVGQPPDGSGMNPGELYQRPTPKGGLYLGAPSMN